MSSSSSSSSLFLVIGTAVTASLATLAVQKLLEKKRRATQRAPKRCGAAIKLDPDQYDLYTQLHDYPWEEILDRMYESNIRNFTIYYHKETHTMFHHFDWIGGLEFDEDAPAQEIEAKFKEDMNAIATDEATREWWALCEPCQQPFKQWPTRLQPPSQQPIGKPPEGVVGDWWAPLVCLNHCGYWPIEYSTQKRDPNFIRQNPQKLTSTRKNPPEIMEDSI